MMNYGSIRTQLTQEDGLRKLLGDLLARNAMITIDGDRVRSEDQCDKLFMLADRPQAGSNQFYMSDYRFNRDGDIDEIHFDKITVK